MLDNLNFITEKEYRALDAVSYSFLKEIATSGPSIIQYGFERKHTDGLSLGSLVDKYISDNTYDYNDDFIISDTGLDLSGTTNSSKIIKYLYKNPDYPTNDDSLVDLAINMDMWTNIKAREDIAKKILTPSFNDQFNLLNQIKDNKMVLSVKDYETAMNMVFTLRTHDFSKEYFNEDYSSTHISQVPILFEINEVPCKSLLDRIIINNEEKTIQGIDLKTGEEKSFLPNFERYKYYLQAAMYSLALDQFKMQYGLDDYEILPFKFVYISKNNPNIPLIYRMNNSYILDYINGFINKYNEKEKGIIDLIEDYKWYKRNEIYDIKRELYEANGIIELKNIYKNEK